MRDSKIYQAIRPYARRLKAAGRAFADPPPFPPGHFYTPNLTRSDRERFAEVVAREEPPTHIPGVDLREPRQWELVKQLSEFYSDATCLLPNDHPPTRRFNLDNDTYFTSDSIFYECMLRSIRPTRVIEVGSGQSSALLLDVNDRCLGGSTEITFIEPYPAFLRTLVRESDLDSRLIESGLQEVPLSTFKALESGDILFIDSTHVSKLRSDVNYLVFEILPTLAEGVHIHIHDIMYPFEYPAKWITNGWSWNEAYLLRAFLQYNSTFEVTLFNTYLELRDRDWFQSNMPRCLDTGAGPHGSIWLRKVG